MFIYIERERRQDLQHLPDARDVALRAAGAAGRSRVSRLRHILSEELDVYKHR